jgi:hypothetical protein
MNRSTRTLPFLLLIAGGVGCKGGSITPATNTELRLNRAPEGRIAIELVNGPAVVRALDVELTLEDAPGVTLESAQPPKGIEIDTVKMKMHGTDRAILFAGDKKGALLPSSGILATFAPKNASAGGTISIARAVVVDENGGRIPLRLGPALTLH